MTKTEIFIYDNIQQIVVDAYLVEGIPLDVIAKANLEWTRIRQEYRSRCKQQGLPYPEHSHWDWEDKVKHSEMFSMIQTRFGIVCRDEVQGLMLVEQMTEFSKLPPNKGEPLLYVKYLEVAPQNVEPYANPRKFRGVGGVFLRVAVDYSMAVGCEGRVGLHALPQAEAFYLTNGMTKLDRDPSHSGLRYFEFTNEQAQEYQKRK